MLAGNEIESRMNDLDIGSPNQSMETFNDKKHTINSCLSPVLSVNIPGRNLEYERLHKNNKIETKTPVKLQSKGTSKHLKIMFRCHRLNVC
jgi:hypothetical protein